MSPRRVVVALAVVFWAGVMACVLLNSSGTSSAAGTESTSGPATRSGPALVGLPYRGVGMQIQRVDWIGKYEHSIDQIAELGADTVLLVIDSRQENGKSSRIYLDMRMTPTPDQLAALIDHAKHRHLRVILMPIVLLDNPQGNEWRGTIHPDSWDDWWDSYRDMITQFAWIAQGHGVDVLVVGSELVSTESKLDQWTTTINKVRSVFKGNITYSANWDHYTSIPFWDQLDLLSMNSYYTLGPDAKVSVGDIEGRWRDIQHDLLAFGAKVHKPLLFLEVGWCSLANAASAPWDYTQTDEPIDLDLQNRLYEAYFNVWYGNPGLGGFMMWEWPPDEGGPDDRGYTPFHKPAEKTLREWLARKPWDVRVP
jgi:hypothetical protein